jgi:ABC-2 type transport system permease protein
MFAIFQKEINTFFSSLIAYIVVGVFLILMGLMMWVFPDYSILEYNFASLEQLFTIAPLIFMFLIPAITMRSFAEEKQNGTIELLVTRPLSDRAIVLGKFFACWALTTIALIPTLLYVYTIYNLGAPKGNLDIGGTIGSYIGLFLMAGAFTAIGVFASSLSNNQIVGFLLGVFLCFMLYWSFDFLSQLPVFYGKTDDFIQRLGLESHYLSVSRGVLDSRDVVYFFAVITAFLLMTQTVLESRKW